MLTPSQDRFVTSAIKRKRLFLILSVVGVLVGLACAVYYGWRKAYEPDYSASQGAFIVILILLNARQNLRQFRYASALELLRK